MDWLSIYWWNVWKSWCTQIGFVGLCLNSKAAQVYICLKSAFPHSNEDFVIIDFVISIVGQNWNYAFGPQTVNIYQNTRYFTSTHTHTALYHLRKCIICVRNWYRQWKMVRSREWERNENSWNAFAYRNEVEIHLKHPKIIWNTLKIDW